MTDATGAFYVLDYEMIAGDDGDWRSTASWSAVPETRGPEPVAMVNDALTGSR